METHTKKGRREDFRLVSGQGKYTSDWNLPDQVHGWFLRSDHAHAEITSIDIGAAAASDGVLAVLTGADTVKAGFKTPPAVMFFKGKDGTSLRLPLRHALAHERVRFVGEPVALVVAKSQAQAQLAAEQIVVEYNPLPALTDPAAALAPGAVQLHAEAPGNLALEYEYGALPPTEAPFAKAAHVVRVTLDAQRVSGVPMEPKACLAAYDAATGVYDMYVPTQGMSDVRGGFAQISGVAPEKIRIHALDVGGAFGVRNEVYPEFAALFLATRLLGRPVKWVGTRSESMLSDHHGRGAKLTGELALDEAGNFLAMRIEWLVDMGAYASNAGALINTVAAPTSSAVSIYKTPAVFGVNRLVFTNATPTTAYRGAGRPNVAYLAERLVDEAARITGIDRIALRKRNLIKASAFPYKTPMGSTYDSGDPPGLLAQALEEGDWKGFEKRRKAARKHGKLRGIGCGIFIEPSGGAGQEEIAIKFDANGALDLFTLSGASGQGHETVFPELVANILGVPGEQVTLRASDPDGPPLVGTGSFGSRSLISHGGALANGAREVIRKGNDLAARELEVSPSDLVFEGGRYRVPGTDVSIGFQELARKFAGSAEHPLDTTMKISTAAAYPSGAHVCEVEIDEATGVLELIGYVAVDDAGTIYNHALVEGQIHGGLMQGIGQMLGEHCIYEAGTGQFLTGSFMDYYMPRADVLPLSLSLFDRPVPSPANPLGAKGAGEAGATGSVPTIANAVMDALKPYGVTHLDAPFTPSRLWAAMQQGRPG